MASEEADLRVRELEAVVDDLHRQSDIVEEVHRLARRHIRHRGADADGLDAHELDARERDAEGKAAVIAELLGTRSDELLDAEAHAAQLRLPGPDPSRLGSSPDDLPSPSIVGTASVPPRPPPGSAVDISPSTAGFSTPVPSPLSPRRGPPHKQRPRRRPSSRRDRQRQREWQQHKRRREWPRNIVSLDRSGFHEVGL